MAAKLVSFGVDPTGFLTTTDPLERAAWRAITRRAGTVANDRDRSRAIHIANAVWGK